MRWMIAIASACGATLALGSCTNYCSGLPVVSGFALYVNETPPLGDGTYHWTVNSDGLIRERDVVVSRGAGHCNCGPSAEALDPAGSLKAPELWIAMDGNSAEMSLMDDPDNGRITLASHVDVTVARDGQTVAHFTIDPAYHPLHADCQTTQRAETTVDVVGQ